MDILLSTAWVRVRVWIRVWVKMKTRVRVRARVSSGHNIIKTKVT